MFVPKSFSDVGVTCSVANVLDGQKVSAFKAANSGLMSMTVKDRVKKGDPVVTVEQFLDSLTEKASTNGGFIYVEDVVEAGGFSQLNPNTGSPAFRGIVNVLMAGGYLREKTKTKPVVNVVSAGL